MCLVLVSFFLLSATVLGLAQNQQNRVYADQATVQSEAYRKHHYVPGPSIAFAKKAHLACMTKLQVLSEFPPLQQVPGGEE